MSDSVQPHRRQPTRLPRPWDPPGKNTGVGCHFLLQCMKLKSESEVAQSCPTDPQQSHGLQPSRLLRPWDFPGKSIGVGCHCLLHQEVLPNSKISIYLEVCTFPWSVASLFNKGIICSCHVHPGSEWCHFLLLVFTKLLFNHHSRIL